MSKGAFTVRTWPDHAVVIRCDECGREGRYARATLAARFGPGKAMPDVLDRVAGTDDDTGASLDRLARMNAERQREWIDRPRRERAAPEVVGHRDRDRLERAWQLAPEPIRRAFIQDKMTEFPDLATVFHTERSARPATDAEFEDLGPA